LYGRIRNLTLAHMAILTNPKNANSRPLLQAAKLDRFWIFAVVTLQQIVELSESAT
jgi:hypothetical protein